MRRRSQRRCAKDSSTSSCRATHMQHSSDRSRPRRERPRGQEAAATVIQGAAAADRSEGSQRFEVSRERCCSQQVSGLRWCPERSMQTSASCPSAAILLGNA